VSAAPTVEVLIPHHNRIDSLRATLDSLRRQTAPASVCVVDNASTDGSREVLAAEYPEVRVVALERNYGFGAALNRGARESEADLLVLLNNDAVADERFVERVRDRFAATGAEMVAACLRAPSGEVESLGVELDRSLNPYDAAHGAAFEELPGLRVEPLGPSGGAGGYAREAFAAVGGFDERIFAYLEDADLALRMRLAGMSCAVAPDAFVWHHHSATLGARSAAKNELLAYARGYLHWRYGRSLSLGQRARALATDAVVYAGKAVIDRDLGSVRGRLRLRREVRGAARPPRDPRFADLPLLELGWRESLARRLARRR